MKVLVYGAGISGQGVAEVLQKDGNDVLMYTDAMDSFATSVEGADLLVLSPGVSPEKEEVRLALSKGIKVVPEVEVAFARYPGRMAAITGTNGKTTTTTLVGEMLKTLGVPVKVAGNIGLSLSKETDGLPSDAWVAAELSSFQLETVHNFTPAISCVLNLTPDHLERHHTLENYYRAKKNICLQQKEGQFAVLNYDDANIRSWAYDLRCRVCYFSRRMELPEGAFIRDGSFVVAWDGKEETVCSVKDMKVFGPHNEENVLAAIAVAYMAGCKVTDLADVIKKFQPVEHRLEYVRTLDGVRYYNDSKATNTDSAVKALESFPDGHVVLIAGGHDKLTDLHYFMRTVKKTVDVLILLGEAKTRFLNAAEAEGIKNIHLAESYDEAVALARKVAKEPQVVLLSPACSSYDMFSCFEERGKKFKELVQAL